MGDLEEALPKQFPKDYLTMSQQQLGEKAIEESQIFQFLEVYNVVSHDSLKVQGISESPDFLCVNDSGEPVGVELARVGHDYDKTSYGRLLGNMHLDASELLASVYATILQKEEKRQAPHWQFPDNTTLVIMLLDYSFDSFDWTDNPSLSNEFSNTGFREIWAADCSTLEAFGEVLLIGLFPHSIFGLRHQPALAGKPYG